MKILNVSVIALLILISSTLFAQENPYVGMTADEFRKILPGVLPDEFNYTGDLYMEENMHASRGNGLSGLRGIYLVLPVFHERLK